MLFEMRCCCPAALSIISFCTLVLFATRTTPQKAIDVNACNALEPLPAAFCNAFLPSSKHLVVKAWENALQSCAWRWRSESDANRSNFEAVTLAGGLLYTSTAPGLINPLGATSIFSEQKAVPVRTKLLTCKVEDGDSIWIMEQIGSFRSAGGLGLGSWHHFLLTDAATLSEELKLGPLFFTAFQFIPLDAMSGVRLGFPPIRIHHMHVSHMHVQRLLPSAPWTKFFFVPSADGSLSFSFDVHGDRQCLPKDFGMDCLMDVLPAGYGIKITDTLNAWGSVNDVRKPDSPHMSFDLQYAYRSTRTSVRPAVRSTGEFQVFPHQLDGAVTILLQGQVYDSGFGTYSMEFIPSNKLEYLIWGQLTVAVDMNLLYFWFHSHHLYTDDMWVIDGTSLSVGLHAFPYVMSQSNVPMNLSKHGLSINDAKSYILEQMSIQVLHSGERKYSKPAIRCMMGNKRFEDGLPRFSTPRCRTPWIVRAGEIFTGVSFHSEQQPVTVTTTAFAHSVFYSYGVPVNASYAGPGGLSFYYKGN